MTTDASLVGWEGHINNLTVQGRWSNVQKMSHINCLEMEAVYLTVKHFLPYLINKNVLIQTDNYTVTCYLNHQGITKSLQLLHLTWKLWSLVLENNTFLYVPQINSHSGKEKFTSRHVIETRVSPSDRVVNEQFSCEQDFSSLGLSNDGSVCNFSEQENTAVLFMDDSSESSCNRCNVNFLAEHVCLCIPTNSDDSQGVAAYETVPLQNNSDSTSLAETVLVSYSSKHVSGFSDKAATLGESAVTGKGESISPRPKISEFDGMAVVDRHFSAKRFSEKTRKLLALSWRKGTRKDYTAKFKQFSMWCTEWKVDPFLASPNNCADFLTSLFQRGLKYRTINGYRSILSSFLPPIDNCPIGQHSYIIRLLKGAFNERPPVKRLIPNWDLSFILGCLKEDPFEPLKDASVKHLTWKTCFLVAITTFRRCSDLQSLQITDNDMNIGERGITFVRTGLSKQDRPNHESNHIFVPVFSQDKYLDPRRCLLRYIKKDKEIKKKGWSKCFEIISGY